MSNNCFKLELTFEQAGKFIGVYELLKADEFIAYKEHIVSVLKEILDKLEADSSLYKPERKENNDSINRG